MGKNDLPPIPSDDELAALAKFAADNPDPRSTESEVGDGEKIEIPLKGFGSPTYSYGVMDARINTTGIEMIEDGQYAEETRAERERLDDEGVP